MPVLYDDVAGNGSNLTGLNASNLASGAVPDARLSSNVPLKNGTNAFSGANSFATNPLDLLVGQLKFPATANPSANANTLDDYEEGTWTPTDGSGAGLVLTVASATYTKIGRAVHVSADLTYPATASGANALLTGLPFTAGAAAGGVSVAFSNLAQAVTMYVRAATQQIETYNVSGGRITNTNMSGKTVAFSGIYVV